MPACNYQCWWRYFGGPSWSQRQTAFLLISLMKLLVFFLWNQVFNILTYNQNTEFGVKHEQRKQLSRWFIHRHIWSVRYFFYCGFCVRFHGWSMAPTKLYFLRCVVYVLCMSPLNHLDICIQWNGRIRRSHYEVFLFYINFICPLGCSLGLFFNFFLS